MHLHHLAVALAALTTTACSASPTDCTLVGAVPQVSIVTADGLPPQTGTAIEVCLDELCRRQPWGEGGQVSVPLPLPADGDVELLVRTGDEQQQRLDVEVETFSPNGPDCGPNVGVVKLVRDPDGALSPAP